MEEVLEEEIREEVEVEEAMPEEVTRLFVSCVRSLVTLQQNAGIGLSKITLPLNSSSEEMPLNNSNKDSSIPQLTWFSLCQDLHQVLSPLELHQNSVMAPMRLYVGI